MIQFSCPKCDKHLRVKDEFGGRRVRCVCCGRAQRAPAGPTPAAPARKSGIPRIFVWGAGGALLAAAVFLVVFLFTPGEVDQKLKDLNGADAEKSKQALEWLAAADPQDSQRARTTAALEALLFDGDVHGNLDSGRLLRTYLHWAGKDNVPAMIRMVQNPTLPGWDAAKAGLVMEALGKMQDGRAAEALAEKLPDPALHAQAVNALELLGPTAENAVMDYVFDDDPDVRLRAGRLLADYGVKPGMIADEAVSRLQSGQADVRRGAVVWFVDNPPAGEAQKSEAAKPLARLLDDLSPAVRGRALQALKLWATKDCLPELLAYARREQTDASGDPRLIDVLTRIPDEGAAEAIALQLANPRTRDQAVRALLSFGPAAAPAVLPYINDPDDGARNAARDLCQRLNVSEDRQREQTLADVADARVPRAAAALRRLAAMRPDEAVRAKVARALNAPLLDPHDDLRTAALDAARVWGTQDNTAALLKILDDFQAGGRGSDAGVIDLLGSLKDPKAAPALAQGLTHGRERGRFAKALIALGPGAEDAVIPFLLDGDVGARIAACRVLGEIGTGKSMKPLQDAAYSVPPSPAGDALFQEAQVAMQKIAARS
jgi:hypothetical protein